MAVETVEALVQSGTVETTYVRAGQGAPVILLRDGSTPAEADLLFLRLAAEFKVIAPELVSCRKAECFDAWLSSFIDGLGLEHPRLVLAAENGQQLKELIRRLGGSV